MVVQSKILVLLLVLIAITACGGSDTEVEVIPEPEVVEPESVEEVIPEPTPEPMPDPEPEPEVNEVGPFDFLETWADKDVEELIKCDDTVFSDAGFSDFKVTSWSNLSTGSWPIVGSASCDYDKFYPKFEFAIPGDVNSGYRFRVNFRFYFPNMANGNKGLYEGDGGFFLVKNKTAKRTTGIVDGNTVAEQAVGGDLYGRFAKDNEEAEDRKTVSEVCKISPHVPDAVALQPSYFDVEEGDVFAGEWRAVKTVTTTAPDEDGETETTTVLELCVKLNTMPGAVKCLVSEYEGEVAMYGVGADPSDNVTGDTHKVYSYIGGVKVETPIVEDASGDYLNNGLGLFTRRWDYKRANMLCHLFDSTEADASN